MTVVICHSHAPFMSVMVHLVLRTDLGEIEEGGTLFEIYPIHSDGLGTITIAHTLLGTMGPREAKGRL